MKKLLFLFLIAATSCKSSFITRRDRVKLEGDELPGIGGDKDHPDTCIMYYDKGHHIIVLKYAKESSIIINPKTKQ